MLITLWNLFFGICCFRLKPQDLPPAPELLLICLGAYATSSYFLAITSQTAVVSLLSALVDTAVLSLLTYIVLGFWRVPERWYQVTSALTGTGIIFNLMATPLSFLLATLPKGEPFLLLVFLLVIILLVWNIAVMAHIMRHALNASFSLGILVSIFYVWLITFMLSYLQPAVV